MDFKLQEYSIAIWTPEIGGTFGDLKLKIKPFLKKEKNLWMRGLAKKYKISPTDLIAQAMDDRIAKEMYSKYLSLIEDWDNCAKNGKKIECTTENKAKYLDPLMDYETGPDKQGKKFTLMLYIANFSEILENYTKNS